MSNIAIITLEAETCAKCGIVFGLSADYQRERRRDHQTFYCPNGHKAYYPGESDIERTKRLLAAANGNAEYYREEAEAKTRKLSAAKGRITKLKNRTAAGLCPCCNRHFTNLERHMTGQHPDFQEDKP